MGIQMSEDGIYNTIANSIAIFVAETSTYSKWEVIIKLQDVTGWQVTNWNYKNNANDHTLFQYSGYISLCMCSVPPISHQSTLLN